MARLFEVAAELGSVPLPDVRGEVRRRLNELIAEDVLGPDWHLAHTGLESELKEEERPDSKTAHELDAITTEITLAAHIRQAGLNASEAQIITYVFRGHTGEEAAEELGMNPSSVRSKLCRARKKLRATA